MWWWRSVSRAYTKAQLASFGLQFAGSMVDARLGVGPLDGAYFNVPAFLIIFILTVLLVRGIRESAEANNVMVAIKIGAILIVPGGRWRAGESEQLEAVCAFGIRRHCHRRGYRLLHLHRL